jgi:hypothetical protein
MRTAALFALALVGCSEPFDTVAPTAADAGSYDARLLDEAFKPGLECLRRETEATEERTRKLHEKGVELEAQIDVMSGAYALRQQLESEPENKAIRHAFAVLRWDGIDEQSKVARGFLVSKGALDAGP